MSLFRSCLLLFSLHAATAYCGPVETHYGAAEVREEAGSYAVFFNGKEIARYDGNGIDLYRIIPKGDSEYLIVDIGTNGLHCRHEFAVLEITSATAVKFSKPFGECNELVGAKYLSTGAVIELRSPYGTGQKQRVKRYRWANGKIARQK
ncbi:hypothetical protein [Noviherbaspirillum massiliense]|uniref:hypothetical protein n=1 Tax=Noviherbaspirillum massiliense TaxID=1465823 RepID=UPI00035D0CAD|nr:hypothetical protein [Noviherbaspirillum massiliense]